MANLETIKQKWQQADKVRGFNNILTLANGSQINGYYYLCSVGAVTCSHNALYGFVPTDGFPTDENGQSVNDRDYFRDKSAQEITRNIAANYDSRAIQNVVIVSVDGVVLSGNGRTMAGEIAAANGTDSAYISYLSEYGKQYGFTADMVAKFQHPRLVFEISDNLPYNAATFAMFNAQEMKSQSKTEQAIKFGKLVSDDLFGRIISTINSFETLSDFYGCTEATTRIINDLRNCNIIGAMQYAEMFDGDTISVSGKELLENVLIGKVFATDADAARMIASYRNVRKSVVMALSEISNNLVLENDYSLSGELIQAISLVYQARKDGDYKDGERVSEFARQTTIFGDTIADFRNSVVLLLADTLNDRKDALLKKLLAVYNHQAKDAASGQTDMFCSGGVKSKEEILNEVKALFATSSTREQNNAISAAKNQRMTDNIFLTEKQLTKVVKGSYVEFTCKSGDIVICLVEGVKKTIAYLSGKGGIKFWANIHELKPTSNHNLSLPEWIKSGSIITDGMAHQRIAAVCDNSIIFEWLNGGYFEVMITDVLRNWQLSEKQVCEIEEKVA